MSNRFLPAEWDPQRCLILTWPHPHSDWRCCFEAIQYNYAEWVSKINPFQPVVILYHDAFHLQQIENALHEVGVKDTQSVQFACVPNNDTWVRDYGPIIVFDQGNPLICKFQFNGWGEQFDYALDNQVSQELLKQGFFSGTLLQNIDLILEGGNIDVNGAGHLLSNFTSLQKNALQEFSKSELNAQLGETLGVKYIHWLEVPGLEGDDTHGHIDTLCRFIDQDTIVYCCETDAASTNNPTLKELKAQLDSIAARFQFRLVPIKTPGLIDTTLPASYINFVFINGALLVPQYGHELDSYALQTFESLVSDRQVIGIDARTLIRQSGALHCASIHIPLTPKK